MFTSCKGGFELVSSNHVTYNSLVHQRNQSDLPAGFQGSAREGTICYSQRHCDLDVALLLDNIRRLNKERGVLTGQKASLDQVRTGDGAAGMVNGC